jgi:hypothetical protein
LRPCHVLALDHIAEQKRIVEPDRFRLMVGGSSAEVGFR